MPELPEVETVRRTLERRLTGLAIDDVEAIRPQFIRHPGAAEFRARVRGARFERLDRRGKYLLIHLSTGDRLIVHLRMTGRLIYVPAEELRRDRASSDSHAPPRPKHTHLVFHLSDGAELRYIDQRTFGGVTLAGPPGTPLPPGLSGLETIGPEPLSSDFTIDHLSDVLRGRRAPVKSVLLDQRRIAGLGNIYADEALFLAHIHPEREAGSLKPAEVEALHGAIRAVLEKAIEMNGTTFYSYLDGEGNRGEMASLLNVYARAGEACRACGGPIESIRLGGRSTHFCPVCQPKGRRRRRPGRRAARAARRVRPKSAGPAKRPRLAAGRSAGTV